MPKAGLLIYLADLTHDYLPIRQYIPLGISFIASYAKSVYGDRVEFRLFKSVDKLLDAINARPPGLVGLSNYTWSPALTAFAGRAIKDAMPDLPIIMGGPNIRTDSEGIGEFLKENEYVDVYSMFSSEVPVSQIIGRLLDVPPSERTGGALRKGDFDGCYSLNDGALKGNDRYDQTKELDYIPSPYTTHMLDEFLDAGMIPLVETNRGCPFSCTFCVWGISALNKLRTFGMDRVKSELAYIARYGRQFSEIYFADANFGILKRDLEIATFVRKLYDETHSFQALEMYWSKSAQPHMVEIGKVLGHLTHTYIAFQSLDPKVLEAMKRKNISTEKLVQLFIETQGYTHSARTDILIGSPEETYDSHLRSLDQALKYGVNHIRGGEIRMLPGSEMDTPESRKKYGLGTKYRLYEGGAGIYRGQVVYELEEVIRSTNAMSEKEMLKLRVIRAMFFGSLTLGEHTPMIPYLIQNDVRVTDIFQRLIDRKHEEKKFETAADWLSEQAETEFFDTREEATSYFADESHAASLFGDEGAFTKLNFDFTTRLILRPEEYKAYNALMEKVLLDLTRDFSEPLVIKELLHFCRQRNYLIRCLEGNAEPVDYVRLAPPTLEAMVESGYLAADDEALKTGAVEIAIEAVTAAQIRERIGTDGTHRTPFSLSQTMQLFWGRCHMEPRQLGDMDSGLPPPGAGGFQPEPEQIVANKEIQV